MYKYMTMVCEDLPGDKQLDEHSKDGWDLFQIIPYTEGLTNISPGQCALYFRRPKVIS